MDIVTAIEKIERFLADHSYARFCQDELTHDAVVRNLEIVSEASRHIPDEMKRSEARIPWVNIADFGNWLRHGYDGLSDQVLWDTIRRDLPTLRDAVRRLLG